MDAISNNNNVNFQARLVISDKGNKLIPYRSRLRDIAKMFKEQTKTHPNDTVEIFTTLGHNRVCIEGCTTKNGWTEGGSMDQECLEELFRMSNSRIVKKFKKILALTLECDKNCDLVTKLENFVKKRVKCNTENIDNDGLSEYISEINAQTRDETKKSDSFFNKNFDFYGMHE